jgi:LmbE family N-acetylglucosaminyl deacetylase
MSRSAATRELTPQAIPAWLDRLGVRRLLVLSPHLDDAVFSVATLLHAAAADTMVVTFFTDAEPGPGGAWTRDAGFSDTAQEFAARRLEDTRAMEQLGCSHLHVGLKGGQLNEEQAHTWIQRWNKEIGIPDEHTLILLPAAAGGDRPYTSWQVMWNRLTRQPFGAPAHGDHRQVRDVFWNALSGHPCRLGFYAELPYVWKQGDLALELELTSAFRKPLQRVTIPPDQQRKLQAVSCYASQMPLVFGRDTRYRERVLDRHETLFLAGAE